MIKSFCVGRKNDRVLCSAFHCAQCGVRAEFAEVYTCDWAPGGAGRRRRTRSRPSICAAGCAGTSTHDGRLRGPLVCECAQTHSTSVYANVCTPFTGTPNPTPIHFKSRVQVRLRVTGGTMPHTIYSMHNDKRKPADSAAATS